MPHALNTLVSWQPYLLPNELETQTYGITRRTDYFPVNVVTQDCKLPVMAINQHVTLRASKTLTIYPPEGMTIAGANSFPMAAGTTQNFYSKGYLGYSLT